MVETQEYVYCWQCRTWHVMKQRKSKIFKSICYECPNCGYINGKEVQPNSV